MLWSGANDGPVYVSRDDGRTWQNVTPKGLPPGGRVQQIDPSPHRKGSAYIAYYRYLLGDWAPYIYRTDDYGKTWTRLTDGRNGIPAETPVRVVREDPERAGLLYAGTEFGMYLSWDNGAQWQRLQLDLPVTPITDMRLHRKDLVISTMGRGFWVLDDLSRLHQWTSAPAAPTLFAPREAIRARLATSAGDLEDAGLSWAPSRHVDYALPADAQSVVDRHRRCGGQGVACVHERGRLRRHRRPRKVCAGPAVARGAAAAPGRTRGVHRFDWDLRLRACRRPAIPEGGPARPVGRCLVPTRCDSPSTAQVAGTQPLRDAARSARGCRWRHAGGPRGAACSCWRRCARRRAARWR